MVVAFELLVGGDCGRPIPDRVVDHRGAEPRGDGKIESSGQPLTPPWQVHVGRASRVRGVVARQLSIRALLEQAWFFELRVETC